MRFLLFLWLCLWFSWISFREIFQNVYSNRFRQDANVKREKVGFLKAVFSGFFSNFSFTTPQNLKAGLTDFPRKQTSTKVKYVLPIYQILQNFTEWNARKLTVSFVFVFTLT